MAALTIERVSKIYRPRRQPPVHAVKSVSMAIEDGEIIGLLGSSGCGKTSTLRMIAGFESISEGEIRIGSRAINALRPAERNVAMAFEGYALYPPLTVAQNIAFALLRDKRPKAEVDEKVNQIATRLEISDILARRPSGLSGGQQQRASLARALIRQADVYLLDEPMSQLEPQLRALLRGRVKDYLVQHGLTTVFVTHDQTEAVALADRIAVMEQGELQQFASPADLAERPANLFVASFIGEPPMNLYEARVTAADPEVRLAVLDPRGAEAFGITLPAAWLTKPLRQTLTKGRELHLGVRPHQLRVGDADADAAVLQARLESNQWLGDQSHIGLDLNGQFMIAVTERAFTGGGTRVPVSVPLDSLHLFDKASNRALFHGHEPAAGPERQPAPALAIAD